MADAATQHARLRHQRTGVAGKREPRNIEYSSENKTGIDMI